MNSLTPIVSSPGWDLLRTWEERPDRVSLSPMDLAMALRKAGIEADVASAIATQLTLRDHAEQKFGSFARHMVFTRDGLEQATRMVVSAHHARRFRESGAQHVADLGCGIGADSLAFAGLGMQVTAFDMNEEAATAAAVNLRDFPEARVEIGDVTALDEAEFRCREIDAIFADPARRTGSARGSSRVTHPEQWSPPLSTVLAWRSHTPRVGVKVAPGIAYEAVPSDMHAQWVSVDGDLVEATLWSPPLAPEGAGRSALLLKNNVAHTLTDPSVRAADTPVHQAPTGTLGDWICEPDPAVIRSGGIAHLAELLDAHLISENIAYLSCSQQPHHSPFVSVFEVCDAVPLRAQAISAALKTLDVGRVEVKKRGADIDPAQLRRSLSLTGSGEATVIATRIAGRHRAIIARRVP